MKAGNYEEDDENNLKRKMTGGDSQLRFFVKTHHAQLVERRRLPDFSNGCVKETQASIA